MIFDDLVAYLNQEMRNETVRKFVDKHGMTPEYVTDHEAYAQDPSTVMGDIKKYVSPTTVYSDPANIASVVYDEMVRVSMLTVPLRLLEPIGTSANTPLRQLDENYFIRMPAYPQLGADLDIDEFLAKVIGYRFLAAIGISRYAQIAKELIEAHDKSVIIPKNTGTINVLELNVRFGDGSFWHENYVSGDTHISFSRSGVWGNAIPLGGDTATQTEPTITKFADLSDVATLEAGKMAVVNAAGTGIVFQDIPAASSGGSTSEGFEYVELDATNNIINLGGDKRIIYVSCNDNVTIDFSKIGYDYDVVNGARYTFVIQPNGYNVFFNNELHINGLNSIAPTAMSAIITLLSLEYSFYCMEQKEF
ncbi:MAG: hypothetical protein AB7D43_03205 [Sulfurimonadaceae bacterium]